MNIKKGTHYLGLVGVVIFAFIVLRSVYPYMYRALPYNRLWPIKRAQEIRGLLEKMHKGRSFSLVIGSCSAESSFRADVLEKNSKKKWYNISLRGATPAFYERLAQKVEHLGLGQILDTVLLVISPTDLTLKQQELDKRGPDFEAALDGLEDIWKRDESWSEKAESIFSSEVLSNIAPWSFTLSLKNAIDQKNTWYLFRKLTYSAELEDQVYWDPRTNGSVSFNFPETQNRLSSNQMFLFIKKRNEYFTASENLEGRLNLIPGKDQTLAFIHIIDQFKKLARKVIVVVPPEYPGLYERDTDRKEKVSALFSPLVNQGAIVLNFTSQLNLRSEDFLDLDHLTFPASAFFTHELYKNISGESR